MSTPNPIARLAELGQSIWYDFIKRDLLTSGELKRLIDQDGLRGMTSNPTIFEKAIGGSTLYDQDLRKLQGKAPADAAEAVMVAEVQAACDIFRPVYDKHEGRDGFVSIECAPTSANDTEATVTEARRLWKSVDRPNVMIKIPGTKAGVPAVRRVLAEGINVNVTLLFAVERYEEIMEAYLGALEERVKAGKSIDRLQSVASFFVSRVDSKIDAKLNEMIAAGGPKAEKAKTIVSRIAIANAKIAYERFQQSFSGARWSILADKGGCVQRPLWASTSTKNPALPDTLYVEALTAKDSVNTVPPDTYVAYRDHGDPKIRIHEDVGIAHEQMKTLAIVGIDIRKVTDELEVEGVASFAKSFETLLKAVAQKSASLNVA